MVSVEGHFFLSVLSIQHNVAVHVCLLCVCVFEHACNREHVYFPQSRSKCASWFCVGCDVDVFFFLHRRMV